MMIFQKEVRRSVDTKTGEEKLKLRNYKQSLLSHRLYRLIVDTNSLQRPATVKYKQCKPES